MIVSVEGKLVMNGSLGFFSVFYILFWTGIILFLVFVTTRFVGQKYAKNFRGKNITVIESVSIGIDKVLHLVKIGNQFFLISTSGKNINFLSQVDSSNISILPEGEPMNQQVFDIGGFSKQLDIFKKKLINKDSSKLINKDSLEKSESDNPIIQEETINSENLQKNIDRIRDMFSSTKSSNKDGVE